MVQVVVLVAAFGVGVLAQGGFYAAGHVLVAGLGALAVALGPRSVRSLWLVLVPCAGLAAWAALRGYVAGDLRDGLGTGLTLVGLVAPIVVLRDAPAALRKRCGDGILAVGVVVAATAWAGVAWHSPRFVQLVEHRLWRGASTITYPNGAAAILAPLALLAIGSVVGRRPALWRVAAAYLLLVGLGATLSRAGVLALAAGLLVLAMVSGMWTTVVRSAPVLLGAGIAGCALAPSCPAASGPHPALACAGLVAGAVVAVGGELIPQWTVAGLLAVAGVAAWGLAGPAHLGTVLGSRGNLDSFGRSGALHASWGLIAAHPFAGTGVGVARFGWDDPVWGAAVATYAHDEYLQTLVDLGAIGALLLLAVLAALGWTVWRGRPTQGATVLWAGASAAVTALAVHSGFDFLWHLAVLPLLGGLLVGLAAPAAVPGATTGGNPVPAGPVEVQPSLVKESAI